MTLPKHVRCAGAIGSGRGVTALGYREYCGTAGGVGSPKGANDSAASELKIELLQLAARICGAKGTRTPDPLLAKQVLFQLSYSPVVRRSKVTWL